MQVYRSCQELREYIGAAAARGHQRALVPTMGSLHRGHISLVRTAQSRQAEVAVSIFVNPSQFNQREDFEKYPRELERDLALLQEAGVSAVFAPSESELYGPAFQSWIEPGSLSERFEGASRKGHFRGVCTVVAMLLNLARPHYAVFGEKDFQQLRIVEQLTQDLKLGVEILRSPLVRDEDGVALSSRNARLSPRGREAARALSRGLRIARDAFIGGERSALKLRSYVIEMLQTEPLIATDYVAVVREGDLQELPTVAGNCRILAAVTVDSVRLIDNVALTEKPAL